MALGLRETRLYARQLALPNVGPAGQARLQAARVVAFCEIGALGDGVVDTAATYLRAAGVGEVQVVQAPADHDAWAKALAGASLGLRFSLDDDGFLPAALEADIPLVVGRVHAGVVELLALREQSSCGHPRVGRGFLAAERTARPEAAGTVLATLACNEALWILIDPARPPAARLLRLPLSGGDPVSYDIPWPPACQVCAAGQRQVPPS